MKNYIIDYGMGAFKKFNEGEKKIFWEGLNLLREEYEEVC